MYPIQFNAEIAKVLFSFDKLSFYYSENYIPIFEIKAFGYQDSFDLEHEEEKLKKLSIEDKDRFFNNLHYS